MSRNPLLLKDFKSSVFSYSIQEALPIMLRPSLFLVACALLAPIHATAADAALPSTIIGFGFWARPAYVGSDESVVAHIPLIRYYGKNLFARTTQGVLEGGVRAEVLKGFYVGGQLAYEGGRDNKESDFLKNHNVENLSAGASWGVHAEYDTKIGPSPINFLARYRQEAKSSRGAQMDLRFTAGIYGGEHLKAGLFAQTTWANAKSNQTYYGITAPQSATTGLAAYSASSGIANSAAGLLWSYDLNAKWMLQGSFEGRLLSSDLRNSPLVQTRKGHYATLGLAYQF